MKIVGYIVMVNADLIGPFPDAALAGAWLEVHGEAVKGPSIRPIYEPAPMPTVRPMPT